MYIKMEDDKSLNITVPTTIYTGGQNANAITFLLPQSYNDAVVSDCSIYLYYILPDGTQRCEQLTLMESYKSYCQFSLRVDTRITSTSGHIKMWLVCIDLHAGVIFKTGTATVTISPSESVDVPVPPSDPNTVIYF